MRLTKADRERIAEGKRRDRETDRVLLAMLKENTGMHFLDSGGAYGRNWERNQGRNFRKEPESVVTVEMGDYLDIQHNLFYWLRSFLSFEPAMQADLEQFEKTRPDQHESWSDTLDAWAKARGYTPVSGHNTYSDDGDCLPQVINWGGFDVGEESGDYPGFIALQIHQGCDVRGGYTAPKIFRVWSDETPSLFDNARATVYCAKRCGFMVDFDGGHCNEAGSGTKYTFPPFVPTVNGTHFLPDGAMRYDPETGRPYCPKCGGELLSGF